jgi:tRNA (cytosine38-C5)-methyltransferase
MKVIEFFSGIGGLHYGLEEAWISMSKMPDELQVYAFDINTIANSVYEYNFGTKPSTKGIDSLTVEELDSLNATCYLLSPPCQPFTAGGKSMYFLSSSIHRRSFS